MTAWIAIWGTLTPKPSPSPVKAKYVAHNAVEVSAQSVVMRADAIAHKT